MSQPSPRLSLGRVGALVLILFLLSINLASAANDQVPAYPFQYGLQGQSAPTLTGCSTWGRCILLIFNLVFKILIYVAGAFAVIQIVLAGLSYIGAPDKFGDLKAKLMAATLGIIVALLAFSFVRLIERQLTRPTSQIFFSAVAYAAAPAPASSIDSFPIPTGLAGLETTYCKNLSAFKYLKGGAPLAPRGQDLLTTCLVAFIGKKILPLIYTLSLLWSIGVLLLTGLQYVQSGGQVSELHKKLLWVIIGVIVTILAFSLVKAIEYSLTLPT